MTKAEYFKALQGRKVYEIIKRDNGPQWTEWRNYWKAIGYHWHAKEMDKPDRHEFTAPEEFPDQIDSSWRGRQPDPPQGSSALF